MKDHCFRIVITIIVSLQYFQSNLAGVVPFLADIPGIHLEDLQPTIPAPRAHIDYSHEASEYEKKLIQVVTMRTKCLTSQIPSTGQGGRISRAQTSEILRLGVPVL